MDEHRLAPPPPRQLAILDAAGAELAAFTVGDDGRLDVTGDEARWTEAAARFIAGVRDLLAMEDGDGRRA
jgi:hypothetical protein